MEYLDYLAKVSTIVAALIGGVFSIVIEILKVRLKKTPDVNSNPRLVIVDSRGKVEVVTDTNKKRLRPKINAYMLISFMLGGAFIGYFTGTDFVSRAGQLPEQEIHVQSSPTLGTAPALAPTPTLGATPTLAPTPTPIAYGDLLMEINFAWRGEGECNDYDASHLGYENKMYYIQPNYMMQGYIAICHEKDDLLPQGALQVTAYPEEKSVYFGYGVLFGWKGGGVSTTDACAMGIRQSGKRTEAVFVDWADGVYRSSTQKLNDITLDSQPHTLRVVLKPDGVAQGYLDGKFFAEHKFLQCSQGPIGMVAWSSGEKIYFDDLKLFDAP